MKKIENYPEKTSCLGQNFVKMIFFQRRKEKKKTRYAYICDWGYDELNEIKYLTSSLHWLRRKIRYAYKIDVYVVRSARFKALLSKDSRGYRRFNNFPILSFLCWIWKKDEVKKMFFLRYRHLTLVNSIIWDISKAIVPSQLNSLIIEKTNNV